MRYTLENGILCPFLSFRDFFRQGMDVGRVQTRDHLDDSSKRKPNDKARFTLF